MLVPAGADIAADWFDLCVLFKGEALFRRFDNTKRGLEDCFAWLASHDIAHLQLVIEPTGRYGDLLAEYFHKKRSRVLLAQPLKFRRYAESLDMRGKTDRKDSIALCHYSKERGEKLHAWKPRTAIESELRDMGVLIRSLTKRSVVLQCQLKCGLKSKYVMDRMELELERIDKELDEAVKRAKTLLGQHPVLKEDLRLVMTIRGIGIKSSVLLLTLIDFRKFKSSRALACFLGLSKKPNESGKTVKGKEHISKRGSKLIRGALFMPARAARMHDPQLTEFSERLKLKGKHDWVIQIAVIRKLVTTAWAVITNGKEYDVTYQNPHLAPI